MDIIERAQAYKALGFAVVPMDGKIPQVAGKPWTDTGLEMLAKIQRAHRKPLGLGLISGPLSGVVVVQTFEDFGEAAFARIRGSIMPGPAWRYKIDNTVFRLYRQCPALELIKHANPRIVPSCVALRLNGSITLLPYDPSGIATQIKRHGIPELPPTILDVALGARKKLAQGDDGFQPMGIF
jgi:hypothetical protein